LDDIHNRDTIGGEKMKRITIITALLAFMTILTSSCSLNARRPFPYGKWENAELGLIMDINPQDRTPDLRFNGTFVENGEKIEVYVFIMILTGDIVILSNPEWPRSGPYVDVTSTILIGRYRLRGERLHFSLTSYWQEQTGITDTIIFERIVDYDVS